jgi:hypothetical protein
MKWENINIFQYQQLVRASLEPEAVDRKIKQIAIINNWTEQEVESLSVEEYIKEKEKLAFLDEEIKGKPVKYINVNGRRYKCIYDIRKLPYARYIESKVFGADFVENIHKLAASMVMPMKKTLFGWKVEKYDAGKHERYAQDMLEARFVDVYHSSVFFYHVYRNWIEVSKDYLIQQVSKTGVEGAAKVVHDLLTIMDGNIPPQLLPNINALRLKKRTT